MYFAPLALPFFGAKLDLVLGALEHLGTLKDADMKQLDAWLKNALAQRPFYRNGESRWGKGVFWGR